MGKGKSFITTTDTDYDLSTISWISDRLGVTDVNGADSVFGEKDVFVINTAGEIITPSDFKLAVDPSDGEFAVRDALDTLADVIHDVLDDTNNQVIVHCYAGMERSVLTCVWYLCKYQGKTVDEAYKILEDARPVALDRRDWAAITSNLPSEYSV